MKTEDAPVPNADEGRLEQRVSPLVARLREAAEKKPQLPRDVWRLLHEAATTIEHQRHVGGQLANVAFNWAQRPGRTLEMADTEMLKQLQRRWDQAG